MSDALATYLHDHLAGSHFAIELLDSIHKQYEQEELGEFALALSEEIKQDQAILQAIISQVAEAHFDLMEAAGWMAEKASQLKLRRDDSEGGIGTFEALESLTLGIRGKQALWHVLPVIRQVDARVPDNDYDALAARAEEQFRRVENRRLLMASITFQNLSRLQPEVEIAEMPSDLPS
jgi:hypothetical protein